MLGQIHSIQTLGTVDGPGVRMVVFFQGCPLRCSYCHNPDTWQFNTGKLISVQEIMEKAIRMKPYFRNGGITFSGGEPLAQSEFLYELVKECKKENINVVIDTSGYYLDKIIIEILKLVDLVLLDIKHGNSDKFFEITGKSINNTLDFLKTTQLLNVPIHIREVIVPNFNDTIDDIKQLQSLLIDYTNIKKIELLPYHSLGIEKWTELGLENKFIDTIQKEIPINLKNMIKLK